MYTSEQTFSITYHAVGSAHGEAYGKGRFFVPEGAHYSNTLQGLFDVQDRAWPILLNTGDSIIMELLHEPFPTKSKAHIVEQHMEPWHPDMVTEQSSKKIPLEIAIGPFEIGKIEDGAYTKIGYAHYAESEHGQQINHFAMLTPFWPLPLYDNVQIQFQRIDGPDTLRGFVHFLREQEEKDKFCYHKIVENYLDERSQISR